jgi:S1-C subfamily serine protease
MDEINLFLSIGGELKPYFEKNVYSLNTENGIMTQMKIETRDWFNYTILRTEEEINGSSSKIVDDKDKKGLQSFLNYKKKKGRIDIEKFNVTTYAGDTLIVKNDTSENIFDLDKGTITKRFVSSGSVNTFSSESFYKCPNGIKSQTEDENNGSSGTAFFVSNRGHLLTNNHVVEGCSISKITYNNKDYDTQLLATDKTLDLALLKADLRQ